MDSTTKTCHKCKIPKSLTEFHRNDADRDKLHTYCKTCRLQYERQWRAANPEGAHERDRNRWKNYSETEKEKRAQRARGRYLRDPEGMRERVRKARKEHPLAFRTYRQRHRAKVHGCSRTLTTQEWEAIKLAYRNRCVYCGKKKKLTQDHVIPLSRGGGHTKENTVPACMACNQHKHTGPPRPFQRVLLNTVLS